jgi:hypothetical protein
MISASPMTTTSGAIRGLLAICRCVYPANVSLSREAPTPV